jgi:hypothetical protein
MAHAGLADDALRSLPVNLLFFYQKAIPCAPGECGPAADGTCARVPEYMAPEQKTPPSRDIVLSSKESKLSRKCYTLQQLGEHWTSHTHPLWNPFTFRFEAAPVCAFSGLEMFCAVSRRPGTVSIVDEVVAEDDWEWLKAIEDHSWEPVRDLTSEQRSYAAAMAAFDKSHLEKLRRVAWLLMRYEKYGLTLQRHFEDVDAIVAPAAVSALKDAGAVPSDRRRELIKFLEALALEHHRQRVDEAADKARQKLDALLGKALAFLDKVVPPERVFGQGGRPDVSPVAHRFGNLMYRGRPHESRGEIDPQEADELLEAVTFRTHYIPILQRTAAELVGATTQGAKKQSLASKFEELKRSIQASVDARFVETFEEAESPEGCVPWSKYHLFLGILGKALERRVA